MSLDILRLGGSSSHERGNKGGGGVRPSVGGAGKRTTPTAAVSASDSSGNPLRPQFLISTCHKHLNSISMLSDWGDVEVEELSVFGRPWQYRGEGNANIVIALQDDLRVVRLSKASLLDGGVVPHSPWNMTLDEDGNDNRRRVEREVAFANSVFIPLLGVEYVGHVQAVHLTPEHIQQLNQALHPLRPGYRLHKELRIPFATAHRDFARIHPYPSTRTDYCVEIKTKQGWWPKHLKHAKCTYCLNQFLKLERSKISRRTEYCPLDLFSGIPHRMIKAILALVSNPQNNLRLFRDGLLVYGENLGGASTLGEILSEWITPLDKMTPVQESHPPTSPTPSPALLSNFVFLLCTALLKPKKTPPFSPVSREFDKLKSAIAQTLIRGQLQDLPPSSCPDSDKPNSGCDVESLPLPEGSILSRILDIQKMADIPGGVESLYRLHSRICPVHTHHNNNDHRGSGSSYSSPAPSSGQGPVIQNLGAIKKKKRQRMTHHQRHCGGGGGPPSPPSSCSSSSGSSSNDDVFELDLDSNSSSSSSSEGGGSGRRPRPPTPPMTSDEADAGLSKISLSLLPPEEEDEERGRGDGCGFDGPGSETSGLSSLSQDDEDDDDEEQEETLREELLKCPGPHCLSMERWLDELGADQLSRVLSVEELQDIESYLIAATAKDCSIMITFSPISGERARDRTLSEAEADSISTLYSPTSPSISNYEETDQILQDLQGTFHRVRIGVADLDPKPVSCIVKHFLRDRDMLRDYAAYNQKKDTEQGHPELYK